jgi:hypothetical protein
LVLIVPTDMLRPPEFPNRVPVRRATKIQVKLIGPIKVRAGISDTKDPTRLIM